MRVSILSLRQKKKDPFRDIAQDYLDKIKKWPASNVEVLHKGDPDPQSTSRALFSHLPQEAYVVLLDEGGKLLTSTELAEFMHARMVKGCKNLVFVVGGPEGVDSSLRERANLILSFGKTTWPHKLVNLMIVEQLYRVQQILNNHPYHKA